MKEKKTGSPAERRGVRESERWDGGRERVGERGRETEGEGGRETERGG